ncbi:MAG: DegT/DnrJ/EryC1/StrS aminotransferase family protein [Bacteroidetes bacterium]|nr:MAG: DegT/DnrJ/EryC1/StrS aminotransferase family protein [Bacteroidota bacterium]
MGMIKLPERAIKFFKDNIDEIFITGNLAEGIWNLAISDHVKSFCQVQNAVPTSSNGTGLVALMTIYRTYFNRSKVLIQSNTMYGVKTMVYSAACEVSGYIDCKLDTLMPGIDQVRKSVQGYDGEKDELIILLSHLGGIINPDIQKIANYCIQNNIILLEDCAHSYGATLNGKHSGTFGDAGVFSFYATKSIPAGEGGVVISKHNDIGFYTSRYVIYDRFDQKMNIGVNIRPSEVQALLIYSVLLCTGEIIANKKQISQRYINVCKELNIPFIIQDDVNSVGNHYKFIIYSEKEDIKLFLPKLKTKTSCIYDYALGNSYNLTTQHVCLPIWYGQESEITDKVIKELHESR